MRESGPWFAPRAGSETLSSDDPPVRVDDPRIDGPTVRNRLAAALTWLRAFLTRPGSMWQLVGVWALGFAAVAGAGMGVAAVLGAPPPALSERIERMVVFPGGGGPSERTPAPTPQPATPGRAVPADTPGSGPVGGGRAAAKTRSPVPGTTRSATEPHPGPVTGAGVPVAPGPGTGVPTTPQESTVPPPVESPTGSQLPTEPETPPADPTDPAEEDPPPTEDPPPVEEPTEDPTAPRDEPGIQEPIDPD